MRHRLHKQEIFKNEIGKRIIKQQEHVREKPQQFQRGNWIMRRLELLVKTKFIRDINLEHITAHKHGNDDTMRENIPVEIQGISDTQKVKSETNWKKL